MKQKLNNLRSGDTSPLGGKVRHYEEAMSIKFRLYKNPRSSPAHF